ncbi:unnamed protein product [Paramecium primaurelia]|uniref:Uncharacterized protein n=1 Tax=Paramecium primaurelia TaxID=5886 RepID=A0A8S1QMF9_PARPR|nr:unnamed protein product [Paramecium primaurelia]
MEWFGYRNIYPSNAQKVYQISFRFIPEIQFSYGSYLSVPINFLEVFKVKPQYDLNYYFIDFLSQVPLYLVVNDIKQYYVQENDVLIVNFHGDINGNIIINKDEFILFEFRIFNAGQIGEKNLWEKSSYLVFHAQLKNLGLTIDVQLKILSSHLQVKNYFRKLFIQKRNGRVICINLIMDNILHLVLEVFKIIKILHEVKSSAQMSTFKVLVIQFINQDNNQLKQVNLMPLIASVRPSSLLMMK